MSELRRKCFDTKIFRKNDKKNSICLVTLSRDFFILPENETVFIEGCIFLDKQKYEDTEVAVKLIALSKPIDTYSNDDDVFTVTYFTKKLNVFAENQVVDNKFHFNKNMRKLKKMAIYETFCPFSFTLSRNDPDSVKIQSTEWSISYRIEVSSLVRIKPFITFDIFKHSLPRPMIPSQIKNELTLSVFGKSSVTAKIYLEKNIFTSKEIMRISTSIFNQSVVTINTICIQFIQETMCNDDDGPTRHKLLKKFNEKSSLKSLRMCEIDWEIDLNEIEHVDHCVESHKEYRLDCPAFTKKFDDVIEQRQTKSFQCKYFVELKIRIMLTKKLSFPVEIFMFPTDEYIKEARYDMGHLCR